MKKFFLLIFVSFIGLSCNHKKAITCFEMQEHIYKDSDFEYVEYANKTWVVVPTSKDYIFEAYYYSHSKMDLTEIASSISTDFGYPNQYTSFGIDTVDNSWLKNNIYSENLFYIPNQNELAEGEHFYWWFNESIIIGLFTFDGNENKKPYAKISIFDVNMYYQ